jgi:aminomethyltransferase
MLVVNASNREKILEHLNANTADHKVKITDLTFKTSMLAIQGPNVMEQFERFSKEVPALKRYSFCEKSVLIVKLIISRTGYTGEDGVEVILPSKMPAMALDMLLKSGGSDAEQVLKPAGLGARDSLRLEAGMPLYGHELHEDTNPLSVGIDFAIALDKGETDEDKAADVPGFIGQDALKKFAEEEPVRKLVGLKLKGRRTPRQGMSVRQNGTQVGTVTSGCLSPTLGYPIAMAMIDTPQAVIGDPVNVQLGSKAADGEIVPLPFYKR